MALGNQVIKDGYVNGGYWIQAILSFEKPIKKGDSGKSITFCCLFMIYHICKVGNVSIFEWFLNG